jgi:hypothetical protein
MTVPLTTHELDLAAATAIPPVPDPDEVPTFLGVPLNRILTIGRGPINVAAGTIASALIVHVHILGLAHVQHDGLSAAIAQGIVWIATAVLTDRGIAQWVKGHHLQMEVQGQERVALARSAAMPFTLSTNDPSTAATAVVVAQSGHPDGDVYDPTAAAVAELEPEGVPKVGDA